MENSMEISDKKTKNRPSYDHTLSLRGHNHEAKQYTQTNVPYRTTSEDMETLIYQKMDGNMWHIYTKQTYSEIKMKERMPFVPTC